MRSKSILLSMLVLAAMVLAACGGGATSTNVVSSPPPVTVDMATDMPTEAATMEGTATDAPGVPVTGDVNPARVSNQLEFPVLSQDGQQVGDVSDLILDLDNRSVAYVIVTANAGTTVAVPWDFLTLQAGTGAGGAVSTPAGGEATSAPEATAAPETTATGEPTDGTATTEPAATADAGTGTGMTQENAFVLTVDEEMLNSAPAFDPLTLPEMGQMATDWDADIRSFWEGGGATGGQATAAPETTATGEATDDAGTGTATVEPAVTATADAGAGTGTGTGQAQALQGVALASDVLGLTVTLGTGMGTGTGEATAVPGTDGQATQTPGTDGTSNTATVEPAATADAATSSMTATIEDLIVDTTAGNILYLVVSTTLDAGDERLIPVPLGMFQWDGLGGFILNADGTMLQDAPFFENGQVPDTMTPGWNSEFDTFWQSGNNAGSEDTTATATP